MVDYNLPAVRFSKSAKVSGTAGLGCWLSMLLISIMFSVAFYALIAYVGVHFITKYW